MKKTIKIALLLLTVFVTFESCTEQENLDGLDNVVAFKEETTDIEIPAELDTYTHQINILSSNVASSDRTINFTINEDESTITDADYTLESNQITIPAGESTGTVSLTVNKDSRGKILVLDIEQNDGIYIGGTGRNTLSFSGCDIGTSKVEVSIEFDEYSEETAWGIYSSTDGTQVAGSGGYYPAGETSAYVNTCLTNGSYDFVLFDGYGDGMQGSFSVKVSNETVISENGEDLGPFGGSAAPYVTTFTVQ